MPPGEIHTPDAERWPKVEKFSNKEVGKITGSRASPEIQLAMDMHRA